MKVLKNKISEKVLEVLEENIEVDTRYSNFILNYTDVGYVENWEIFEGMFKSLGDNYSRNLSHEGYVGKRISKKEFEEIVSEVNEKVDITILF